jgi:hypothetical protein
MQMTVAAIPARWKTATAATPPPQQVKEV